MPRGEQIVIAGAGLAGLAAALELGKGYRLVEASDHPGGLCDTVEEHGYRFDRTGHLLHTRRPEIRRLVLDWLDGRALEVERRSRVFSHGVYTPYPFQANTFGLPPAIVAECLEGFIEARSAARKLRPRTFEDFIMAHFGAGIARHFMMPYNAKLWGVPPREIGADWCRRFVPVPTPREVARGAVGLGDERMGYNARFLYPERGIGALPDAMASRARDLELATPLSAVDFRRRRVRLAGEWVPYQALVSTIPLPALVRLLVDPPRRILDAARALRCASLSYVDMALARPAGGDFHWAYVPEPRYPFYRVGCYSRFSRAMAPPGKDGLYVELASRRPAPLDRLLPRIVSGLSEMGVLRDATDVAFARLRRLPFAYVIPDANHARCTRVLRSFLEEHRILLAGRFGRFEYSSMEDAIAEGIEAARLARRF